jgi:hypothetical protein
MSFFRTIQILFLYLLLAATVKGDGSSTMSFIASPFKADLYPYPGFPLKGKLLLISIEETNAGRVSKSMFYLPNDGTEMYCVTTSLQNMNRLMKNEFPDGLGANRANEILRYLLFHKWMSSDEESQYYCYPEHMLQMQEFPVSGKECLDLTKKLFTMPKIEIRNNHWIAFTVVTVDRFYGISFRKFSGTLKPLMITENSETVLVPNQPEKTWQPWSVYWTEDILRGAIKEKNALLSKQLTEWEKITANKPANSTACQVE